MYSFGVYFQSQKFSFYPRCGLHCKNDNLNAVIRMKWIVYLQLNPAFFSPPVASPQSHFQYAGSTSALIWTRQFIKQVFIELSFPFDHRPTASSEKMKLWWRRQWRSRRCCYYILLWIIYLSLWTCQSLRWETVFLFGDGDNDLIKSGLRVDSCSVRL